MLVPESAVRLPYRNGMFSIPKDAHRDMMVLDARPPNALEDGKDSSWIQSLGSVSQFNHWFLREDEEARVFSEDIREFYHAFLISPQRVLRNALAMEVEPYKVHKLKCFQPWMWKQQRLVPCLRTMAMGDCRAVTYGQVSHPQLEFVHYFGGSTSQRRFFGWLDDRRLHPDGEMQERFCSRRARQPLQESAGRGEKAVRGGQAA